MLSSWKRTLRYGLIWTLLGVYLSIARTTEQTDSDIPWWVIWYTEMTAAYLLGLIFPLVKKYYELSYFSHWSTLGQWLRHIAILPFIILLICVLMDIVRYPFYANLPAAYGMDHYLWLNEHFSKRILLEWPRIGVIYLSMILAIFYRKEELKRSEEKQRGMRLQNELSSVKLLQLKSQLRPHFLFNTLNMISEKIVTDPLLAEGLLQQLSDLLRYYLAQSETSQVKLSQEMTILHSYLAILQKRFPSQIHYEESIADELLHQNVPSMLLQPVLENAVMHTIHRSRGEVSIALKIVMYEGNIHIEMTNTLPTAEPASESLGIGLKSVQKQLELLYGDKGELTLDVGHNRARLEIVFPATRAEA